MLRDGRAVWDLGSNRFDIVWEEAPEFTPAPLLTVAVLTYRVATTLCSRGRRQADRFSLRPAWTIEELISRPARAT